MTFTFYAGKGGVGKTTCAAARAVALARARRRVLIASTDPAHSLGDALGVRLSSRVQPVVAGAAGQRFDAVELDAATAFRRWLDRRRTALADILEQGTWLDRDDVEALLALPMPGVDELTTLTEIHRLSRLRPYDEVIVDTAPTGHTLRLLASPDIVATVAGVLDAVQQEHRIIREQLARVVREDAADRLIAEIAQQSHEVATRLRDPMQTHVQWVMLPEPLSIAETDDGMRALAVAGVHVGQVTVNRVTRDGPSCPICDRRRSAERRAIAEIARRFGKRREVVLISAQPGEPRGIDALAKLNAPLKPRAADQIARRGFRLRSKVRRTAVASAAAVSRAAAAYSVDSRQRFTPPESIPAFRDARLLMFVGKGGVGKTTCAAATALRLARSNPSTRLLLLSTDPAHSAGDVLGVRIGDRAQRIRGGPENFSVRELDAEDALARKRTMLEAALSEIAGARAGELLDLAPPGIDELLAVLSVADLTGATASARATEPGSGAEPRIVIDMAPTGHAMRLLEMPAAVRTWLEALMRVLLKYRSVVRPGPLGAELVALSKSVRHLQDLLRDRERASVVVVTRSAELPRLETDRVFDRLRRLKLSAPALVINAQTLAPGSCPVCRATASHEQDERQRFGVRRGRRQDVCVIIQTPLAAPPPRGVRALERWAQHWIR